MNREFRAAVDGLVDRLDWRKGGGLLPAIIQDHTSGGVLMLGYMNREALLKTAEVGQVTFYSRSKDRLWTKGETSGNHLTPCTVLTDCDQDALLIGALPAGPVCHTGLPGCFGEEAAAGLGFPGRLDRLIARRKAERPADSYTTKLFNAGIHRMAQKVGEEGVEVALAAKDDDDQEFLGEAADLLYHLLVLLRGKDKGLRDVVDILVRRHS